MENLVDIFFKFLNTGELNKNERNLCTQHILYAYLPFKYYFLLSLCYLPSASIIVFNSGVLRRYGN